MLCARVGGARQPTKLSVSTPFAPRPLHQGIPQATGGGMPIAGVSSLLQAGATHLRQAAGMAPAPACAAPASTGVGAIPPVFLAMPCRRTGKSRPGRDAADVV